MGENSNTMGMGITSIWDIIVLVIVSRLFGFGLNGEQNGQQTANANPGATEAQIERAIRTAQDTANINAQLTAITAKQADCCCENRLGQKDIINGQTMIADAVAKATTEILGNQKLVALQGENRELARDLSAARNDLNNCNQTSAFTAAIHAAVDPIAQALSAVVAQLNCGVKSVPYTASVPAYLPPVQYGAVPGQVCGWGTPPLGYAA